MFTLGEPEYFDFQKHRTFYWKLGAGEPIVFIHNAGVSHVIWSHQIAVLSKKYTCYALDLPGYGKSTRNTQNNIEYSLAFYTDFLHQFINKKKIAAIILVGNCLGSAIALNYTYQAPENVKNLILFHVLTKDIVTNGPLKPLFFYAAALKLLQPILKKFLGKWNLPKQLGKYLLNIQFGTHVNPDAVTEILETQIISKELQIPIVDLLFGIDSYTVLDEIEIKNPFPKTMVLWGSKNRILMTTDGHKFCKEKNIADFKNIIGGGHLVMYEMADVINPLLQKFLEDSRFCEPK